ncbi:MAG: hypothetical protein U0136_02590 [Bdellovibrionota bacterium]
MANTFSKLDQALKDLIEAYVELEGQLEEKHGDDEESMSHAMIEALETAVEGALEEHDYSSSNFAGVLSLITEALEQLDPAAFEEEGEEYDLAEVEYELEDGDIDDADIDDADLDDVDLDEDEEDGDDDDDDDDD